MILFRLVAQIVSSPHFFGDWQIEDSIRKIFSVRAWRCHLKVTIWLKAFTTSITNIIIDYMMIFRLAASIWTFTTSDDFQTAYSIPKMSSVREQQSIVSYHTVKVIICIKVNITLIPGITLDYMFIFRLVALIRTSTSFDNWQTAELIRKMSSVREFLLTKRKKNATKMQRIFKTQALQL